MVEYQGIRDINKEPANFDETKPTIFIDIDGVINALPYERVWIGPEGPLPGGMWDPGYNDPANWRLDTLTPDLELQYPISRQIHVELDRWMDHPQSYIDDYLIKKMPERRYKKIRLNLMDEMLDELRGLIQKYDLQVVYLTFWRSEALRLLEPELKLGATTYLDWFTGSDRGHALKIDALASFYEQTDIRTPFVILDDESTRGITHEGAQLWYSNPRYAEQYPEKTVQTKELNSIPKLILQQDIRWGIERLDLQKIREFAESLKS